MLQSGEDGVGPTTGPIIDAAPGAVIRPADPGTFRAATKWVRLDHLLIRVLVAEAHTIEWTPAAMDEVPGISITVIGSGAIDARVDSTELHLGPGDAIVLYSGHPLSYTAAAPVRLLTVTLDADQIPLDLSAILQPPQSLRRTPLLHSYIAFVSALMGAPRDTEGGAGDHAHLGKALADLHIGVLAEAHGALLPEPGLDGLRYRIVEHIDTHLTDPGLAPAAIAAALGISLRYAHQVFSQGDVTIARFIRERRLAAVAAALEAGTGPEAIGELATRFGFGSHDQLTRAFRQRYGVTPSRYRSTATGRES